MLWKDKQVTPYYARSTGYKVSELRSVKILNDDIKPLPVYTLNRPKKEHLEVLRVLMINHGRLRKWRLIDALEKGGIINQERSEDKVGEHKEFTMSAKHGQLRRIIDPMRTTWKYVDIEDTGRRCEVVITEQGKDALKIFGKLESK
jgi:hypothetical protein